jgi:N-acetylneuraminic acid mutarotase
VSDGNGSGHVWQINDPENRGNMTGGTGNFADINSDYYGSGNTQDTTLTSPAVDLTGETAPVIRFNTDYQGYGTQTGNVDLSTDGGTTWSTVWHQTTSTRTGLQTVPITQAAGDSNVEVRFHFTSTFGWWWQVDNVTVQNQNCDITPGGLVVGNVTDGNNGNYLNGAVITSADNPGTHVTTVATSDPANPGGYYQFFYPLTGSHPFTATDAPYTAATKTANVAADSATSLSFSLAAARLTITPSSVTPTQLLGNTATSNLTIANTGNAPATVKLDERSGAYQVLSKQGAPVRRISFDDGGEAPGPGWFAGEGGHAVQDTSAGTPKDPTWSTIAQYPSAIEDNSSDSSNGLIYSVGGYDGSSILASGYVYDPSQNTWSAIAPMPVARERPNVAFISGKLYVSGGWGTDGNPVAETDVYDPSSNSWSIVAPNPSPTAGGGVAVANGQMFIVDGCSDGNCDAATTSVSYDPGSNSWSTIAAYPNPDSWESCGGIAGKVYCAGGIDSNTGATYKTAFVFDPSSGAWSPIASLPIDLWGSYSAAANGLLLTSAGVTDSSSTITNQGFSYDPSSDSWTALPNAQYPLYRGGGACGFYKVGGSPGLGGLAADSETLSGFTECGVTDVPWLDESATTATLQPGQSVTIAVTTSATTADSVTQPGTYTAQLGVEQNTPYPVAPVNITMTVTPPSGWGKIAGTVTGTTCKGVANPILGAQVQADSKTWTFSLKTDKNGNYAFWAPAASNPFQIIASQNTWIAQTTKINIKSQKTTTINFNLSPTSC